MNLLIIGAGPAGMAAAITARRHGLDVIVIDDQPTPGGQIWRSIEVSRRRDDVLGPSYVEGRDVAEAFRTSGATYEQGTQFWQIDKQLRAYVSKDGISRTIDAEAVIFATGAQERPVPFKGWTLPGVMTVGAGQILLKASGQIPSSPVWIAGCGPLPLLYAVQLLRAGGQLAGYLDTTIPGQWRSAVRHLPKALRATGDLIKGLGWQAELRRSGIPIVKGVAELEAEGRQALERIRFRQASGDWSSVVADVLLVHEGVVPNLHPALSLDCEIAWNAARDCFEPVLDGWGESSVPNLFVAGDGAGIAGAKAAYLRGELAALRVANKLGRVTDRTASAASNPSRRKLARELAVRPFLDALFKPRSAVFAPSDDTLVCRCEEVTAREVREIARYGRPGPNQVKAATRCGMGPCQGRQCGYSISRLIAAAQGRPVEDVGYFHVRPPLKPVTLGELASLDQTLVQESAVEDEH